MDHAAQHHASWHDSADTLAGTEKTGVPPTTSLHVWKACDPLTDHAFLSVTPTCSLPSRNVALIRRTQSDGPDPIEETVDGWKWVSSLIGRSRSIKSVMQPNPRLFTLPSHFVNQTLTYYSFPLCCVCRRSKCLCFRVSLCGRTTFWLHLWPAARLRCRLFQHRPFLLSVPGSWRWKILKERPEPSWEIRLLDIYLLFCVLGCSDVCYDIEELQLGCYCSLQVSEGKPEHLSLLCCLLCR